MISILVVDDEEGIRVYLADALEEEGQTIVQAADGVEALAHLAKQSFGVMITDLRMPGALDGIDLLRKARAESPEMEVIVLTAHGSVDSAVEAMKLGAFDYLQKPVGSPAELRLLVGRALERRASGVERPFPSGERGDCSLTFGDPAMLPVVRASKRWLPPTPRFSCWEKAEPGKRSPPDHPSTQYPTGRRLRPRELCRHLRDPHGKRDLRP